MVDLTNPIYQDADKARKHLENLLWPDGPVCPHCGSFSATKLTGKSHRAGLYQCNDCRQQFSVTVGTVFERSKVPLNKWMLATHLLTASKKGMSAHQLHRMLGVTYKTAWFMAHRIREAMIDDDPQPMGGEGKTVEADETYIGSGNSRKNRGKFKSKDGRRGAYYADFKQKVFALVERDGSSRSFHVKNVTATTLRPYIVKNVYRSSELHTDEARYYKAVGKEFARHGSVNHSANEYVRGNITTNSIEGYFSILKRGLNGVYQHVGEQHLQRYLTEFDFRYNHRKIADGERAAIALKGIEGKRLTYRPTDKAQLA